MDYRFKDAPLLDRRKEEWNLQSVKETIKSLFDATLSLLDGYSLESINYNRIVETKEHIKKSLIVNLKSKVRINSEEVVDYDFMIPELYYDQYFMLNGNVKIPLFQLYDLPIIYRNNILKFRNNTLCIGMDISKGNKLSIFKKSIPLPLLLSCCYTQEEIETFYNEKLADTNSQLLSEIYDGCTTLFNESSLDSRINDLGEYFSIAKGDKFKKGSGIIFSLKSSYTIDIFTQKFMSENSILFELLKGLYNGPRSDTDLNNKRLRFKEYILAPLVKKLYDVTFILKTSRKAKFQITKTIIYDVCNKSDIVRFQSAINPVSEVAQLLQCTMTGPGGFKKENVPANLRNLDSSHFWTLCPVDTPDRNGCGVTLNIVPTAKIDENGLFIDERVHDSVASFPIDLIPFMEHNDQTRLQMASNHTKQAILLKKTELPMIRSSLDDMHFDKTCILIRAKEDGTVIHVDSDYLFVLYNSGKVEAHKIGYMQTMHKTIEHMLTDLNKDDAFKADQILVRSRFINKNGQLQLGSNLVVAVIPWKGFNYEDGIVISDKAAENNFTSLHYIDLSFNIDPDQVLLQLDPDNDIYNPLPHIGDFIPKGSVYAKIKSLDHKNNVESINIEPKELTTLVDCRITNIQFYPNCWNSQVEDYKRYVDNVREYQIDKYNKYNLILQNLMPPEEIKKVLSDLGISSLKCDDKNGKEKFQLKQSSLRGVFVKIEAIYEEKIGIGDKITNRHGNKGIVAKIEDEKNMPLTPDGRRVNVIINPLGIIGRMNSGQLYELNLTENIYNLKLKMHSMTHEEGMELLHKFLNIVDKTENKFVTTQCLHEFEMRCKSRDWEFAIDNISIYQPPFKSIGPDDCKLLNALTGAEFKYHLHFDNGKSIVKNPIACGYMYMQKAVHRANEKFTARSIGPYSKRTLQPVGGRNRQGGHRVGEMEIHALIAHGAKNFLHDLMTVHSDSPGLKTEFLAKILNNPGIVNSDDVEMKKPQSLMLLDTYLRQVSLRLDDDE